MIPQVDEALRSLIRSQVAVGSDIEVVFDAPTTDWAARRSVPTINVYLYDIREDMRRREGGLLDVRDETGRVVARRPAPRHFRLSYLVTAWTQRPEDEHLLLASVLACLIQYEAMPPDLLGRPLAAAGDLVRITVGVPPSEDRNFADVWSALGGELKPSLDVVITAPFDAGAVLAAGPPVLEGLILGAANTVNGGRDDDRQQRSSVGAP